MLRVTLICGSFGDSQCGVGDYSYALARQLSNYVNLTVLAPNQFLKVSNTNTTDSDNNAVDTCDKQEPDLVPFFTENSEVTLEDIKGWLNQNQEVKSDSTKLVDGTFNFLPVNSFSLWQSGNLTKLIKATNPDIVHIQYPAKGYQRTMGIEFLPLRFDAMVETAKLVTTIHEYTNAHWLRKAAIYPMACLSHLVITPTQELAKDLSYYRNSNVSIIPVGNNFEYEDDGVSINNITQTTISRILSEESIPNSLFHFGFITKGKGIENLLYALAIARLRIPDLKLYLASNLNPKNRYHKRLLTLMDHLKLTPWIEILGEQPVAILKAIAPKFSYQVFPFDDGLSDRRSSTISALELKAPIITTIANKPYPLLSTEPKNPYQLAELIVKALSSDLLQERSTLINAQTLLKSFYSFKRLALEHVKLYQKIL